jgi:Cu/Ag efflux protein CusF
LSFLAFLSFAAVPAAAQPKAEAAASLHKTATITAINPTTRVVTLKDATGRIEDFECGPEVKRFNELKVGDSVTFSYHAAVVVAVTKPGAAGASKAEVGAVRGQGAKPSAAITHQRHESVTIEAIDAATPSITVKLPDGHSMTAQVEDRKNLEGVKVGDKITVTFTEALMVTVDAAKK